MSNEIINWDSSSNTGETEPITVTLEGEGTVDFQTAFGDYSEARGRGRRRRQKRRLDRIRRRQERRSLRRAGRKTAMQERQAMRTERKQRRVARKEIGKEEDEVPMEEAPMEEAPLEEAPIEEAGYSEPQYADTYAEEEAVYEETGPSDEGADYSGDYGFDGKRTPSELDQKYDDFYAAEGISKVNPKVAEISRRIEKNKELAKNIEGNIFKLNARITASGKPASNSASAMLTKLNNQLNITRQRIADLEAKLAKYTTLPAAASSADGTMAEENARRKAEVRAAKKAAREERRAFIRGKRKARIAELVAQKKGTMPLKQAMAEARAQARAENPFKVTEVEGTLQAEFSPQRIEIAAQTPSESSFDGTGLIGLDNTQDFDAPPVRNVELDFSNADGKRKIDWLSIGIGIGVTALGIFVYHKFLRKK